MTYQKGGTRIVMNENEGLRVKPMDFLERRRRRNKCLSLSLLALCLSMCASLVVYRARHRAAVEHAVKTTNNSKGDSDDDDDDGFVPSAGLAGLNMHLKDQSKVVAKGCESTLLIIRHCEKMGGNQVDTDGNYHCSYVGRERAYFFPTLFGSRWPIPSQLFALTPERDDHLNFREYETLHPLSLKIGIPIEISDETNLAPAYFKLLQSGDMCGKLAVVSWKHAIIPALAKSLGCSQDDGCPDAYPESTFDQVWQLKYVFDPPHAVDFEDETELKNNSTNRRWLHKKHDGWKVYATISQQGFDPLSYSYKVGDYPDGGAASGGKWRTEF